MELDLLNKILIAARSHDDLPDAVVEEVAGLAIFPGRLAGRGELLQRLFDQLEEYDPYAGAGCFGSGATLEEIGRTLEALKAFPPGCGSR